MQHLLEEVLCWLRPGHRTLCHQFVETGQGLASSQHAAGDRQPLPCWVPPLHSCPLPRCPPAQSRRLRPAARLPGHLLLRAVSRSEAAGHVHRWAGPHTRPAGQQPRATLRALQRGTPPCAEAPPSCCFT